MQHRYRANEWAQPVSDIDLRDALAAGEVEAGAELYRRYSDRVRRSAQAVLRDETLAADIAHDVFLELLRRPDAWCPERSPLGAFLVMLGRRRAIDLVRRNESAGRRERSLVDPASMTAADIASAVERSDLQRSIRLAVIGLPPEQRSAVAAAFFGGRSYRQVADVLGIPEGTAKTRLRAALTTLRRHPDVSAHA